MAVKKVIDIEVNDAAFQRFVGLFNKYQEQLQKTPDAWKKVADQTGAAVGKTTEGVEETAEQTERMEKAAAATHVQFSQMFVQIAGASKDLDQAGKAQANHWRDIGRNARGFAVSITEATRSLLRWASITGVISGLLGAGGLFGIARLATSAGESRRSALGLGVTPGEQKAFGVNFGRVVDSDRLLGGVNEAMHDVTKRVSFFGAGLSNRDLAGKSAAEIGADLIPALKKIADRTPDAMMAQVLQSRHLDQFIDLQDFQRLKRTPAGELSGYRSRYEEDRKSLDLTQQQQKAWQDLQVQLRRAGEQIETVFIWGLAPLAPQIEKLSDAFSKAVADLLSSPQMKEWITDLGDGIKWLAEYIRSPEFKEGITDFAREIASLAKSIGEAVRWIKGWFEPAEKSDLQKKAEENGWGWDPATQTPARLPTTPPGPMPLPDGYELDPYTQQPVRKGDKSFMDRVLPRRNSPDSDYQPFPDLTGGANMFSGLERSGGLPPGILDAVWSAESGRGSKMLSRAGAQGHFQFMPDTARQYGVENPYDLGQSSRGAARYISDLLKQFGGDTSKALAAYNWGPGNLQEAIGAYGSRWKDHLPQETMNFVNRILGRNGNNAARTQQPSRGVEVRIYNNTSANVVVSAKQLAT